MKQILLKHWKDRSGATFIELLLYIAIFLILTPILLNVSINAVNQERTHNIEKQINIDSQFMVERIYDLIVGAKKINAEGSVFNEAIGKLSLVAQDDGAVIIELNPDTKKVEITENALTAELSSENAHVESLYFERITGDDPEIILSVIARLNISGVEEYDTVQNYITSANLERGDFDEDGSPDFIDRFPRHPECAGDADNDGSCDELDNCVMSYNPFQEDFDEDGIGDECDSSVFVPGGGGGGGSAFNCSNDAQLISLLEQHPPVNSPDLKNILVSSSPLPNTVLNYLINLQEGGGASLSQKHFRDIFIANTKLPDEVYQNLINMQRLPDHHMASIIAAHELADFIPWLGVDQANEINYQVSFSEAINLINFFNASNPLGGDGRQKTDIFILTVQNAPGDITATTRTASGSDSRVFSVEGDQYKDASGYEVIFDSHVGDTYVFKISCLTCSEALEEVTFDFGEGAIITNPETTYSTRRYTYYCPGGCEGDCGDVGTGIITGNIFTDQCYKKQDELYPEWCSKWKTFLDSDIFGAAYVGGTQVGEEDIYWEKEFKLVLGESQLDNLQSIIVAGEVAYQRLTQLFCDQFGASCTMYGNLIGVQDVELYNWNSNNWEVIGATNTDSSTSDQQSYEAIYDGGNPQRFVGGEGNHYVKARMRFHWDGVPPAGQENAPAFMLIDYFTLHLKW